MIETFIEIAPSGMLQGLVLSLLVIGVMIPFKLLDFPDLSAEGSYPLGAAASAGLIVLGVPPIFAVLLGAIAGGCLGIGTAFVHLKYHVNTLLAGIILSTMVYSLNLRLLGGPNVPLFSYESIFMSGTYFKLGALLFINTVIVMGLVFFLKTENGLRFRVVGTNKKFAEKQGINVNKQTYLGLFIANLLCGLSGALMVQLQSYADIGIGVGIVIYALAGLMIGEKLIGSDSSTKIVIAPFVGALIYTQIQGLALSAGLAPTDLKMLTGAIVLLTIAVGRK